MKYTYRGERSIEPLKSHIDEAEKMLYEYYKQIDFGTPNQIAVKVEEVIEKAKWGWDNASLPKDIGNKKQMRDALITRVNQLMGGNNSRLKNLKKARARKNKEEMGHIAAGLDMTESLANRNIYMDAEEIKYVQKRFKEYFDDFDFNQSSDMVLLNQIITDEVILQRLDAERLDKRNIKGNKAYEYEGLMKEILDRYRRNIDLLGVSRKQRSEFDDSIEGNVAALSMNVEEKLDRIKSMTDLDEKHKLIEEYSEKYKGISKEELEDYINELEMTRKHDMFPEKNFVSETELLGQDSDFDEDTRVLN